MSGAIKEDELVSMKYLQQRMSKKGNIHLARISGDIKWIIPLVSSVLLTLILLFTVGCKLMAHRLSVDVSESSRLGKASEDFVERGLSESVISSQLSRMEVPRLAYLISGTRGDGHRMIRVLQAVYHPRNKYILHLDLEAPPRERLEVAAYVKNDPTFCEVGNVRIMAQANLVTYRGPTMIACTLHAIAILLKESLDWDWFINLSAADYPLVTQDDLLYVLSNVSRSLNFIELMTFSGWKLNQRARPVIIDPGLHLSKKSDLFYTSQQRSVPTSFHLFTGSAWVMLTRSFLEYCVMGWDNLPRLLLLYFTNFISSPEGYFHTVICNSKEFKDTAVSHDLHYIAWDKPPKQHPHFLTAEDFDHMVNSNASFARKFARDNPVLDKIDKELLGRTERFAPGAWCVGGTDNGSDPCLVRGNHTALQPGPGARRLQSLIQVLISKDDPKVRGCPLLVKRSMRLRW